MSDWPAPSSPVPKKQSPRNGCMGALPQIFQWSRVLGSNSKCITTATDGADVQMPSLTNEKHARIMKEWTKHLKPVVLQHRDNLGHSAFTVSCKSAIESSRASEVGDTMGVMDLRQVLQAKQEPFVLQDVIQEKRHPIRTSSSRQLICEALSGTRGPANMKNRTNSKDQGHDAGGGYSPECYSKSYSLSPKTPTGSAAVVRRNRVPVESMVAIPSHRTLAVGGGHSATKEHTRTTSLGRNPVKSPNKRALLMEAAARVLEGNNRRTSKRPSTSARSLLEELEKSTHVKKLSNPKEKLVRSLALQSASSEREEIPSAPVAILGKEAEETKQHHNSCDFKCLDRQTYKSSCKNQFEMSQIVEDDLLVIQKREFPYDAPLDAPVPSLATPVQNQPVSDNESPYERFHDDLCSEKNGFHKKTINQIGEISRVNSSEAMMGAVTMAALPEVSITEGHHPELDYDASFKNSKAIVPSACIYAHANFPRAMLMGTCVPSLDYRITALLRSDPLARNLKWGYHAASPFLVDSREKGEGSHLRTIGGSSGCTAETPLRSVMQLRLCNYSWWAPCPKESTENQLSAVHCIGYDSPIAVRCPPYCEKVWKEETTEEGASGYVCAMDPFYQASPVSVLEPVSEDLELDHFFDNFEDARQKLLKNLRRYEMLAQMDVNMLKKVSEEHVWHGWDYNKSWETDYSYSCSSSSSAGASDSSYEASPDHDISSSNKDELNSSKRSVQQPHVCSLQDQSSVEMRRTSSCQDSLTEKLELRPISCRVKQYQQVVGEDEHIKKVAGRTSCNTGKSIVSCLVNSLLQEDQLAISVDWTSHWKQDEEGVEFELESCFFEVLMCELLFDLRPEFKLLCKDAFELGNSL